MFRHFAFRWFRWIRRRAIQRRLQEGSQHVSGGPTGAEPAVPNEVAMQRGRASECSTPSRWVAV